MLERTTCKEDSALEPKDANKRLLLEPPLLTTESSDQQQVSMCLIFNNWRFSVQFVTPTSQFTPSEGNGLVYKPHPRFLAQNLSKKVRLIYY